MGIDRLQSIVSLGLGFGRLSIQSRTKGSNRFCRRNSRAYFRRGERIGSRYLPWPTQGVSSFANAAKQSRDDADWSWLTLGRVVWLQRGKQHLKRSKRGTSLDSNSDCCSSRCYGLGYN